jgi:hypothetical protein
MPAPPPAGIRCSRHRTDRGIQAYPKDFDARGREVSVLPVGKLADADGFLQVQWHEHDLEGRERNRPDNAAVIVVLFDCCGHHSRNPDAVTAHEEGRLLA